MPSLSRACFITLGLLLTAPAAIAQCDASSNERLGVEFDIAYAKVSSLRAAPASEYCPAARYRDSLHDSYNRAYRNYASCNCMAGSSLCSGLMEEYSLRITIIV